MYFVVICQHLKFHSRLKDDKMYKYFFKRFIDIFLSVFALIITSFIMLIVAVLIKAESPGEIIFKQQRIGKNGKVFNIYKFRSMCQNAEKTGTGVYSEKNDSRVTKVGKFIRATSIDELPQFVNILKGDMSFVGPRPERPEIAQKYEKTMPEFKYRLKVKAGLTGYAQVMGKYNTTPYDKLKLDLMYIEHQSLMLDLRIFFMTVKTCFIPEATEGVKDSAPLETHRDRIEHDNSKDENNSEEIKL